MAEGRGGLSALCTAPAGGAWVGRERPTAAALIDDVHNRLAVGDVHGFARGLETFFNDLAHENLINEACFRAVLQTPLSCF